MKKGGEGGTEGGGGCRLEEVVERMGVEGDFRFSLLKGLVDQGGWVFIAIWDC